jgi:hypothetical protein
MQYFNSGVAGFQYNKHKSLFSKAYSNIRNVYLNTLCNIDAQVEVFKFSYRNFSKSELNASISSKQLEFWIPEIEIKPNMA